MKIGAITCGLVIVAATAFAQGPLSSLTVAHEYVAAASVPDEVAIPGNVDVAAAYRPLLTSMLERSPMFRRQCLRLASDLRLTVHLHPAGSSWTHGARAVTRIRRKPGAGGLEADIYLTKLDDDVELIAHELEHIIEQLDQIDLPLQSALPDTGVHRTISEDTMFETTRARQVGLRVAREVRAAGPRAD